MNLELNQHDLKALLCVVPKNSLSCEIELKKQGYNDSKIAFFRQNYGCKKAHITDKNTYALELCVTGLQRLFDEGLVQKDEPSALIISTHTMDYFAPNLSALVHKELDLSPKMLCFDKIGFCTSFINSLFEAFLLLENKDIQRLVLVCVSTKSKKKNPADTLNFISDSVSVALLEKAKKPKPCFYKSELLSGYALEETKSLSAYKKGFSDFVNIDNKLIFQVVQSEFQGFLRDFCEHFKLESADFTQFLFNSSNSFFHQKLVQSLNLDAKLCFCEAYKSYTNADCNNIPLNLCLMMNEMGGASLANSINSELSPNARKQISLRGDTASKPTPSPNKTKNPLQNAFLASFGTGINISAMALNLSKLKFARIFEV